MGKSCQYEHYSVKGTFDPLDVFMAPDVIPKSTYWPGITLEAFLTHFWATGALLEAPKGQFYEQTDPLCGPQYSQIQPFGP